ncbi:MAG: hypothetical protein ABI430_02305 [Candidatus Taylorbacteria bacterium]
MEGFWERNNVGIRLDFAKGNPWRVFRENADVEIWVDCAKGNPWRVFWGGWRVLEGLGRRKWDFGGGKRNGKWGMEEGGKKKKKKKGGGERQT